MTSKIYLKAKMNTFRCYTYMVDLVKVAPPFPQFFVALHCKELNRLQSDEKIGLVVAFRRKNDFRRSRRMSCNQQVIKIYQSSYVSIMTRLLKAFCAARATTSKFRRLLTYLNLFNQYKNDNSIHNFSTENTKI